MQSFDDCGARDGGDLHYITIPVTVLIFKVARDRQTETERASVERSQTSYHNGPAVAAAADD